ncbi:MAG: FAD-dependent oxidoreductase [Chloroflexi bacterium]|nr:FAD-dependent oxidoreductase [Chloroflexota bacterium]MCI0581108.1 FAD-dependent oxidoreductase [Chloroflexota bacterium]MCI0647828.1 FAD-dependent oxidoreductase [Chloroflexota bacterium]MCI0727300.1 FAD-dependent oxidoreductase [Chloroflexota bacterium]
MWDVIIVGGGYCGVTAAIELERRSPGIRLLLLEAADQLGGRARSVTLAGDGRGPALDLGAHYFGVRQRRLHALAHRLLAPGQIFSRVPLYGDNPAFRSFLEGAWRTTTKKESFFEIQGLDKHAPLYDRISIFKSLATYLILENLVNTRAPWRTPLARRLDQTTVAAWIAGQKVPQWIREMWGLACLDILSVYPQQISLLYWLWYHATNRGFLEIANDMANGPQEFAVDIGLGGLLQRYAGEIRGTVQLKSLVVGIDHSRPDRVVVTTAGGQMEEARRVVVAVTPHAAGHLIHFDPPLQPARELLHRQPIGHAAKAIFVYREPWWWDCHDYHYYGLSAGPLATGIEWLLDTSHPGGGHYSLMTFVNDRFFERFDPTAGREAMKQALARELAEALADERALDFVYVEIHRWQDVPTIGGGPNTSFGPGVLSQLELAFNRPEGVYFRLYFASAEYSTTFTGYVEGAMAAGEFVAAQVAYDAQRARELSLPRPAAPPKLPGRRPRYLHALLFFLLWLLLRPVAALARLLSSR